MAPNALQKLLTHAGRPFGLARALAGLPSNAISSSGMTVTVSSLILCRKLVHDPDEAVRDGMDMDPVSGCVDEGQDRLADNILSWLGGSTCAQAQVLDLPTDGVDEAHVRDTGQGCMRDWLRRGSMRLDDQQEKIF